MSWGQFQAFVGRDERPSAGRRQGRRNLDAQGQLAAEFSAQAPTVAGTEYLVAAHLGSTRMAPNASGGCLQLHDYLPFGEDTINTLGGRTGCYGTSDGVAEKFTGKERDSETTLDFFDVRYFSGAQGRFTSPDAPLLFADSENPQGWNLYVYGLNNPILYSDPSGHDPCVNGVNPQTGATCITVTADAPKVNYFDLLLYSTLVNTLTVMQSAQQIVQPAVDWLGRPRDPNCMGRAMLAGGLAGAEGGAALGLATGGTLALGTVSVGALGGAGFNGIAGLTSCMSGGGGGAGGQEASGSARPKGVPKNWKQVPDNAGKGGYKFADPDNPNYNYVRVRADGTITQVKNGQALDVSGSPVKMDSPAAHYPSSKFVFKP